MTSVGLGTRLILFMFVITVAACANKIDHSTRKEISDKQDVRNVNNSFADPPLIEKHIYGAVGIGSGRLSPDANDSTSRTLNDRVEAGGQITFGFDVNRHFSLELHSADLGSAGFSPTGRINYHLHGGSALLYFGENRRNFKRIGLNAYARLGLGYLDNSATGDVRFVKDNATTPLLGAGVEYTSRIGLGLRAEAIAYQEDALFAQLGVVFRFGRARKAVRPVLAAAQILMVSEPVPRAEPEPIYDPCANLDKAFEQVNFHTASAHLTDAAT